MNSHTVSSPRMTRWQRYLLCAAFITLLSAVYLRYDLPNFRISTSVMVLPVLLLTLVPEQDRLWVCCFSALCLFLFRFPLSLSVADSAGVAFCSVLPGCLYYCCYGLLFRMLVRYRRALLPRLIDLFHFFLCDYLSNLFELSLDYCLGLQIHRSMLLSLLLIALSRAVCSGLLLALYCQYHTLLTRAEHEERYQRLYLMKTRMRSELYFLSKDKASIENTVKAAYHLYEKLTADPAIPKETSHLALQIACDIHDLKKDYIRIEQGFYEELGSDSRDDRAMQFSGVLHILEQSTLRMLGDSPIRVHFSCADDFLTAEHYALMSILRCLVNNSIEAIQSTGQKGDIYLSEQKKDDRYLFTVTDNGPGISPKHRDTIFQLGFSTKYNASTGSLYRGMGLPNVKMVTEEQLKGTVAVESEVGRYTTFTISVPADILEVPQ